MGTYAEITLTIDFKDGTKKEMIDEFIKKIDENQELSSNIRRYDNDIELFLSSCRVQNLEYQLEIVKKIIIESDIIEEAVGSIMIESGDSFFYNSGDDE